MADDKLSGQLIDCNNLSEQLIEVDNLPGQLTDQDNLSTLISCSDNVLYCTVLFRDHGHQPGLDLLRPHRRVQCTALKGQESLLSWCVHDSSRRTS